MPCITTTPAEEIGGLEMELAKVSAIACAAIRYIEHQVSPLVRVRVDWEGAGVPKKEALAWWAAHKVTDAECIKALRKKAYEEAKKQILETFTPDQIAALRDKGLL